MAILDASTTAGTHPAVAAILSTDGETADAPAFACTVRRTGRTRYLQPAGELDLATAPVLDAWIDALRADGVGDIVVDLRAVTFVDGFALGVLLERAADLRGVIPGCRSVQRVFDLTRTAHDLPFLEAPYPVREA
jgi:anti-anti-sigma factor